MVDKHNASYWTQRYENGHIQWDTGSVTTPLKDFFDQLEDKDLKILIPGCGNAYEAAYLHENNFKNVYLADISEYPLKKFAAQYPTFPEENILHADFFELATEYDLIVEQTFFCSLSPDLRPDYAKKTFELLKPGGHLVGVLFDAELNNDHPPYGGHPEEYVEYFKPYFIFRTWERCYNSIKPRAGREWFINLIKPARQQEKLKI